jgi:trimeric autotransporter adhesin
VRGVRAAAAQQPAAEATTTASTTAAATVGSSRPLDTNAADSMTASTNIKPMETVEVQHTEPEALQGGAPGTTAAEGLPSSIDAKTAAFPGESIGNRSSGNNSDSDSDDDDDEQPGNDGAVTAVIAAKPTHAAVPDNIAAALLSHELSSADASAPSTRVQGVGEGGESLGHDLAQHREEPATAAAAAAAEAEAALKAVLFVNGRDVTCSSGSAGAAEGHTTGASAPARAVAPAPAQVLTAVPNVSATAATTTARAAAGRMTSAATSVTGESLRMRTPLERLRQRFGGAVPSALPHTARQATAARSTQRHSSGCAAGATATDPLLCLARAASSGVIPPLDECHAVFGVDSQHTAAERMESLSSSGIASSSSSSSGNGPATTAVELPDVATLGATAAPVQQHIALLPAAAAVVEARSVDVLPTITLDSSVTIQFGPASPDAVQAVVLAL